MGSLPTLLVVDVQKAFDLPTWGPRNNPQAEERVADLLEHWRKRGAPIIHIRHRSTAADGRFRGDQLEFKPEAAPRAGEPVVEKRVNSAFIGTDLEQRLRQADTNELVIAGLTTDHCCSTTARMAANLGFTTYVVADAMATFARNGPDGEAIDAETMHRTALASLMDEFATVVETVDAVALFNTNARAIIDAVADQSLLEAVAARFYAVNGRHPMTDEDDAYASAWFMPVEEVAQTACIAVDEIRRLQLADRLPLPSYIRRDGTQMVARDLLELANEAGGFEELPAWFARQWESPVDADREWNDYLHGLYVCLRQWRPENMRRKDELVASISAELERPQPHASEWLERLHQLIDELDALEPPFAPYDRLRFGGPVSRDRLITALRRDFPLVPERP